MNTGRPVAKDVSPVHHRELSIDVESVDPRIRRFFGETCESGILLNRKSLELARGAIRPDHASTAIEAMRCCVVLHGGTVHAKENSRIEFIRGDADAEFVKGNDGARDRQRSQACACGYDVATWYAKSVQ